jgi:foldase protein PrsA
MRYLFLLLLTSVFVFCGTREKGATLEKDSDNYALATRFAEKVPEFNPDDNLVVLTTDDFDVTVGDVVIRMRSRFGKQVEQIVRSQRPAIIKLYKELAESVAYSKIIDDLAAEKGIAIKDAYVDSILQSQYKRAGGEEKYTEFILSNGISMETLRSDIKTGETQRLFMVKRSEEDELSEEEIDEAMNGDRYASVRHILLMFQQTPSDSQKQEIHKKMEGILERAKAGEDFAELAKTYSEDPGSKNNGGLYENFEKGRMVPEFDKAAFSVPVGEISDIVETQYGYHILKIVDRKKEDRQREAVVKDLQEQRKGESFQKVYEQISEDYNFKFADELEG